jgi:cell division protease FtsH
MKKQKWLRLGLFLAAAGLAAFLWARAFRGMQTEPRTVPYSELLAKIESGGVAEIVVEAERLVAKLEAKTEKGLDQLLVATRLPGVSDDELLPRLKANNVAITGHIEQQGGLWAAVLSSLLPLLLLFIMFRASGFLGQRGARPMSFGKSQAKIFDRSSENNVTFEDVAGVDESKAELIEVVNFLKNPEKYRAVGARVPKGVLLGVRRDVRWRGREPRQRPLRASEGASAVHRVHRRARRGGEDPRRWRRLRRE